MVPESRPRAGGGGGEESWWLGSGGCSAHNQPSQSGQDCRAHNTANEPKVTAPLQRGGGLPGVGKAAWSFVGRGGLCASYKRERICRGQGRTLSEQPIETNPKAGQRSSTRTQSKPVNKKKVKLWPVTSIRTVTVVSSGTRVTLWVSRPQ